MSQDFTSIFISVARITVSDLSRLRWKSLSLAAKVPFADTRLVSVNVMFELSRPECAAQWQCLDTVATHPR